MSDAPTIETPKWSLLAADEFRHEFHGEAKTEDAPIETEEPTEPPVEVQPTETTQKAEESQEVEEVPISSIDELAKHYELDPEWLETVKIPVKINHESSEVPLSELKKSYQIQAAAQQRLDEAKATSRAETAIINEKREKLTAEYNVVANLVQKAEGVLLKDYQSINWQQLRTQDPAEFSARQTEFVQRQAEINNLKQSALQSYQTTQAATEKEVQAIKQQALVEETGKLLERIPEWKDQDKYKAEGKEIAEYLVLNGLTKEEVANATDHRLIVIARKAMLFDRGQNKVDVAKKKVLTIPKVLKPGSPKSTEQVKSIKKNELKAKLRKSGTLEDALAVLRST